MSRDSWTGSVGAPQSLDRYAYVNGNPITNTDPSGRWTIGFCVTAEIQIPLPLLNFGEGSLCIVLASAGQVGVTGTLGGGGGAGVEASSGFAIQVSSGDDIEDLAEVYGIVGASGALGVGLQGEGFGGFGRCGQLVGGVLGGVVVGGGASVPGRGDPHRRAVQARGPGDSMSRVHVIHEVGRSMGATRCAGG